MDVTEVEVMDDDAEPRHFSEGILELRRKTVMQEKGNATFKVKTHVDDMVINYYVFNPQRFGIVFLFQRRIILGERHYFFMGVNNTPFSLVIALPQKYGFYRVQHPVEDDIHRIRSDKINRSLKYFFTGNWTIHPDW